jgi:hypothetical protein
MAIWEVNINLKSNYAAGIRKCAPNTTTAAARQ